MSDVPDVSDDVMADRGTADHAQPWRSYRLAYLGGTEMQVSVFSADDPHEITRLAVGRIFDSSMRIGDAMDVETLAGVHIERIVIEEGEGPQVHYVVLPPAFAIKPDPSSALQPKATAYLTSLRTRQELNNMEVLLLWRHTGGRNDDRWAVRLCNVALDGGSQQLSVPAANLVRLRPHVASREAVLTAEAQELLGKSGATEANAGGTMSFGGEIELPAELAMVHLLSRLSRCTISTDGGVHTIRSGQLEVASEVCKGWHGVCLATRALLPACARDVRAKLHIEDGARAVAAADAGESCDGEYTIYWRGEDGYPMRLYCHNVLSSHPSEFLTLRAGGSYNFSYIPCAGAIVPNQPTGSVATSPTHVATRFSKLRICPWTTIAKTDDYTFSSSASRRGGPLCQRYWNGQRTVVFEEVPYATARDAAGHWFFQQQQPQPSAPGCGHAEVDLSGTEFGVRVDRFCRRGCGAWGRLVVPLPTATLSGADQLERHVRPLLEKPIQQRLLMDGGGFAGRLTPDDDLTRNEKAAGGNFDHEGRNGGWVLPLLFTRDNPKATPIDRSQTRIVYEQDDVGVVLRPVDEAEQPVHGLAPAHAWLATRYVRTEANLYGQTIGSDGRPYEPCVWRANVPPESVPDE